MPTTGHTSHADALFKTPDTPGQLQRLVCRDGTGPNGLPVAGTVAGLAAPIGMVTNDNGFWGDVPVLASILNPAYGFLYQEPFTNYDATATTGDWTLTQATSGTAAIATTIPGALKLDPGATTAHQGVQIQRNKCAFVPASKKSIWYEVTVLLGAGLTTEFFAGLAETNTALITTGTFASVSNIGWSSTTADGIPLFNCTKASTAGTAVAGPALSITVPHRLGFFYDGNADTVQAYFDGAAVGSAFATTYVPKVVVYPSFVGQVTGTTQTTVFLSGLQILQLR